MTESYFLDERAFSLIPFHPQLILKSVADGEDSNL